MATLAPSSKGKCKRRLCEAGMCSYKERHMFKWPSNSVYGEKWTKFVNIKRNNFKPDKTSRLCYQHFNDDQFTNMGMYKAKLINILHLEKTAVPTIHLVRTENTSECAPLSPRERTQKTITPKEARWLKRSDPTSLLPLKKLNFRQADEFQKRLDRQSQGQKSSGQENLSRTHSQTLDQSSTATPNNAPTTPILSPQKTNSSPIISSTSNTSSSDTPQILDAYTVTSSETLSSSEITESSAVKDEPGDVEITAPVVLGVSDSNLQTVIPASLVQTRHLNNPLPNKSAVRNSSTRKNYLTKSIKSKRGHKRSKTTQTCWCCMTLEKLLAHPNFIPKLAAMVRKNKTVGSKFIKAFKCFSDEPKLREVRKCTVDTQTDGACVPVLNLEKVDPSDYGGVPMDVSQNGDFETLLDFVPNCEKEDEMGSLFGSINQSPPTESGSEFYPKKFTDLINSAHMKLEYHHRPPDVSISSSGFIRSRRSKTNRVIEKLKAEYSLNSGEDAESTEGESDSLTDNQQTQDLTQEDEDFNPEDETDVDYNEDDGDDKVTSKIFEKRVRCALCNQLFNRKSASALCCQRCKVVPPGIKTVKYRCPQCSFMDKNISIIKSHMLLDHQNKATSFKCETCDRFFLTKKRLLRHELTHETKKPYLCGTCGKGFTQSNNLQAHMRQHTGDKPFQCEHCGQSFTHNVSLRKHFCKHLGRRIEPLDQKNPNIGRPPRKSWKSVETVCTADVEGENEASPPGASFDNKASPRGASPDNVTSPCGAS